MADRSTNEKDILDWFDDLDRSTKWRIAYYLIEGESPSAETLSLLKNLDEQRQVAMHVARANPGNLH